MSVVAIAGGSGHIGRKIVEAIVATGKHEVKILSRKADAALEKEIGVPFIVVDYADVAGLTKALEDNKIDTLISALAMFVPGGEPPEVELIQAADASKVTKRIVSSEWAVRNIEEQSEQLPSVPPKLRAREALAKSKDLEHTVVHNGFFLDYWCMTAHKSYMPPIICFIDVPNNTAAIPGSGDVPISFTHTTDVGRYVAALLDVPNWEPDTYVSGDKITGNDWLKLCESVKGTKFEVTYDSLEKLKSGKITELPAHVPTYQVMPKEFVQMMLGAMGAWVEEGFFNLPPTGYTTLNKKFPDIKPLTMKEALEAEWNKA